MSCLGILTHTIVPLNLTHCLPLVGSKTRRKATWQPWVSISNKPTIYINIKRDNTIHSMLPQYLLLGTVKVLNNVSFFEWLSLFKAFPVLEFPDFEKWGFFSFPREDFLPLLAFGIMFWMNIKSAWKGLQKYFLGFRIPVNHCESQYLQTEKTSTAHKCSFLRLQKYIFKTFG